MAPTRLAWPPAEPMYGDYDRRPGIEKARQNPDFHKDFKQLAEEQGLQYECHPFQNQHGYN